MAASHDAHSTLRKTVADGSSWQEILMFITGGYWIDQSHWLRGGVARSEPVLPEAVTQPYISPRVAILHTNAGPRKTKWESLISYWRRADVTGEAHFQVHGVNGDAAIVQAIPLNRRADCNAKANRWSFNGRSYGAISFETEDRGYPTLPTTPWSLGQLDAMSGALTSICVVYGMSCTEPATWSSSGIGFHSRFQEWSIYKGKTCPGAARIAQMAFIRDKVASNLAAFGAATGWRCGQGAV